MYRLSERKKICTIVYRGLKDKLVVCTIIFIQ